MHTSSRSITLAALLVLASTALLAWSDKSPDSRSSDQSALEPFQGFIGKWRGVGQLRRGSSRGSWRETGAWAWSFADSSATLRFQIKDGKYLKSAYLESLGKNQYRLTAVTTRSKKPMVYEGHGEKTEHIVLTAKKPSADNSVPARITLRTTAGGKRLLVLLERKIGTSQRYTRLAEVGYTREGSGFGKGTSFVECVVTGGKGTIPVSYKGKTYYVCCGGCRDLFNEDPATVLAEYQAKKKKKK